MKKTKLKVATLISIAAVHKFRFSFYKCEIVWIFKFLPKSWSQLDCFGIWGHLSGAMAGTSKREAWGAPATKPAPKLQMIRFWRFEIEIFKFWNKSWQNIFMNHNLNLKLENEEIAVTGWIGSIWRKFWSHPYTKNKTANPFQNIYILIFCLFWQTKSFFFCFCTFKIKFC